MKKTQCAGLVLAGSAMLFTSVASADDATENRFTLSARFGFNISGKFKDIGRVSLNNARFTPDGTRYNYDDGYVLTDVSGNFGNQTWNWGYDDSSRQVSGDTILFNRATGTQNFQSSSKDDKGALGAELVYNRQLGANESVRWGIEAAVNFLDFSVRDSNPFRGNLTGVTDTYAYTPGTTPPTATPGSSYQGTFNGPGFVIGGTPISSMPSLTTATVSGHRKLEADIWGFRLGPYVEFPISEKWNLSLSGGMAAALLDAEAKWSETLVTPGGNYAINGRGSDCDVLWGGYLAANLAWKFSEHWSAVGGLQYQYLGIYEHSLGGRAVEINLKSSIFATIGIGYSF